MGTVNVTLGEDTRLNLILGQQLENAVTSVVFDFSAWQTAYGSGTLALSVQRPGDEQPYAVTLTTSGTDATWSVTNLDTAYKGVGHIQLTYTVGSAIKKSVVYKFTVYESLGANGEYPSPGQTWQEEIEDELDDVKQDLLALEQEGYPMASITEAVDAWMDNNGEEIFNVYVTPEQFGAKGDGITNDTSAIISAVATGKPITGNGKYKITSGQSFSNVKIIGLHLYFDSNDSLTSGAVFDNCILYDCTFESVNDKASPWNGATGNFSNIYISSNNSYIDNCTFKNIEYLSLGDKNGNRSTVKNCIFNDCASGVIGNGVSNVRIYNCYFDLLDYAGELEHTIYASNDCSDWVIDGIVSKGCKYYPIHIYNSHEGENPTNITVVNSSIYDSVWAVANNGELKIENCYFDNSDNTIQRLLFANGKTQFINCDLNCSSMLFILTGDQGIIFDGCNITCDNLIGNWGSSSSGKILLTIKNCCVNAQRINQYNRSFELKSYNNIYETYIRLIDNTTADVLADLFFKGDIFKGTGDIVYANHVTLIMLDCFIDYDSARITMSSRSTTSGSTAFLSNNTAKVSGNYISYASGFSNLAKNNCFNINP